MRMIYPIFAMFLLSAFVLVRLFLARVRAARQGEVDVNYFRLYQGAVEPRRSAQWARHFANLLEAPVLFYAVCLAASAAHRESLLLVALAWLYVAVRIAHAWVHLTFNGLRWRIRTYMGGWVVLAATWGALLLAPVQGIG